MTTKNHRIHTHTHTLIRRLHLRNPLLQEVPRPTTLKTVKVKRRLRMGSWALTSLWRSHLLTSPTLMDLRVQARTSVPLTFIYLTRSEDHSPCQVHNHKMRMRMVNHPCLDPHLRRLHRMVMARQTELNLNDTLAPTHAGSSSKFLVDCLEGWARLLRLSGTETELLRRPIHLLLRLLLLLQLHLLRQRGPLQLLLPHHDRFPQQVELQPQVRCHHLRRSHSSSSSCSRECKFPRLVLVHLINPSLNLRNRQTPSLSHSQRMPTLSRTVVQMRTEHREI